MLNDVLGDFRALIKLFQENNPAVIAAVGAFVGLAAALKAAQAAQAAFDVVADANPYVLVAIAIAAFIAALVALYLGSRSFTTSSTAAWEDIRSFTRFQVSAGDSDHHILTVWDAIKTAAAAVWPVLVDGWTAIKNAAGPVFAWLKQPAWQTVTQAALTGTFGPIVTAIITGVQSLLPVIGPAVTAIKNIFTTVFNAIGRRVRRLSRWCRTSLQE